MRVLAGGADRSLIVASALLASALAVLTLIVVGPEPSQLQIVGVAALVVGVVSYRAMTLWPRLLAATVLVILFIPIKRYKLPGNLPFDLEPYRLIVGAILLGWLGSLLVDPRVRFRRTGLEAPLTFVAAATLLSVVANPDRVGLVGGQAVIKALTFLASFILVFYVVVSVIRSRRDVEFLVRILVGGSAVLGALAFLERRTGYNVFDHLSSAIPFLQYQGDLSLERGGRFRVFGSAQHPIALGVALVTVLPLAVYLARRYRQRRWYLATALIFIGLLVTTSRTAIVGLMVVGLTFFALHPRKVFRLWPAAIPVAVAIHFLTPGVLGTIKQSFFPPGGIVAEQSGIVEGNDERASGRLADIGPSLAEYSEKPVLGQGYFTRVIDGPTKNARILDNQWLGILLETGYFGVLGWLWLFVRSVRRLVHDARGDESHDGWLFTAIAASVAAYPICMLTYDAFSFIQSMFLFFVVLGLGAALMMNRQREPAVV